MTTIHFNTSRLYQAHGQRITVQVNPDGTVLFMDHSRMIGGKLHRDELRQRRPRKLMSR